MNFMRLYLLAVVQYLVNNKCIMFIHIRFVKYSENTNSTLFMPVYLLALRFVKFYNVYRPPCD